MDSYDLIGLLMRQPKAKYLQAEAATAYVQRETGSAVGIARAIEAATNPTEGQRMLQHGFRQGAIMGGESSENTSAIVDANGIAGIQRVVERAAISEDGKQVLVQQVQQTVKPSIVGKMATRKELSRVAKDLTSALVTVSTTNANSLVQVHDSAMSVIVHKMDEMKEYVDRNVMAVSAKQKQLENRHNKLEAKGLLLEKRIASMQSDSSNKRKCKKNGKKTKIVSKNISFANGSFSWRKTINSKNAYKGSYRTFEEAKQGLAQFCQKERPDDADLMED